MHYIIESTFARIFLFLELPLLQGSSIYRENLFPLTSATVGIKDLLRRKLQGKLDSCPTEIDILGKWHLGNFKLLDLVVRN